MALLKIDPKDLILKPHTIFDKQMVLLTCGNFCSGDFNEMTIGWGALGTMWNKPFALIAVRPHRYTFQFLEKYPDFTLTVFPPEYRQALRYLGSHSGREGNKLLQTELTPKKANQVDSPTFEQAELSLECSKMYFNDLNFHNFIEPGIERHYPTHDYHRMYFGEILQVWGTASYLS